MLQKIQRLFVRVVDAIEGDKTPLSRYFQLFFAILAVRLMLEFYSNNRRFELDDIIHIGLWFSFIVLAFLLQLKLYSGVPIGRVSRLVVVCFTIALTAPIIDLLFFGGKGVKMNYLAVHSWQDLAWSYLTIGGSSLSRGATPGIRVEIVLLMIASFNYIRTKTGSWLRSIVGAISIYTVLFLSGTLPKVMNHLVQVTEIGYAKEDQSTVLMLLALDLVLLGLCMAIFWRDRLLGVLKKVSWIGALVACLFFGYGMALSLEINPGRMEWNATTVFYPAMWVLIGVLFLVLDGLSKEKDGSRRAKDTVLILLCLCGFALGGKVLFMVLVYWGAGFLLHDKPLRLVEIPVLGHFLRSLKLSTLLLMGWIMGGGILVGYPVDVLTLQVMGLMFSLIAVEDATVRGYAPEIPWLDRLAKGQQLAVRIGAAVVGGLLIIWSQWLGI